MNEPGNGEGKIPKLRLASQRYDSCDEPGSNSEKKQISNRSSSPKIILKKGQTKSDIPKCSQEKKVLFKSQEKQCHNSGMDYIWHYIWLPFQFLIIGLMKTIGALIKVWIKWTPKKAYNRSSKSKIFAQIQRGNSIAKKRLTLLLDLDETLIHSSETKPKKNNKFTKVVYNPIGKNEKIIYVEQRPSLNQFLDEASELFNIYVFTASEQAYADAVIQSIDIKNCITESFYRNHCVLFNANDLRKDIAKLCLDTSNTIILDNSEKVIQRENHVKIKSWNGSDPYDQELIKFLNSFKTITSNGQKYFPVQSIVEQITKDLS